MEYLITEVSAVLLADGWHEMAAGSAAMDRDPSFTDPSTGASETPQGGPWLRFTDAGGALYAAPLSRVQAIRVDAQPPPGP